MPATLGPSPLERASQPAEDQTQEVSFVHAALAGLFLHLIGTPEWPVAARPGPCEPCAFHWAGRVSAQALAS
eukprot:3216194-Pyramimonas_sp.AAC.1